MNSSESSSLLDTFKSKKAIRSGSKILQSDQVTKGSDHSPWSSKTPEKPTNPPRRGRSQHTAMSLQDVRRCAQKLQKSGPDPPNLPNPFSSTKKQIKSIPVETPVAKSKKTNGSTKLPEKYEILDKFFSSLDSSIRLVRIKGGMSTLTNIIPKIECLTDRRFSHRHLAQLKFILPEAIEISKVLIRDEHTCCMKPDLHITLNTDAIQNEKKLKSDSENLQLRKIFRARLIDFFKSHPEVDEVPEDTLPEPFNHSKQDLHGINQIKASNLSSMNNTITNGIPQKQPAAASHVSESFRRQFSKKVSTIQEPSMVPIQTPILPVSNTHLDQKCSRNYPPVTPIKELVSTSSTETPAKLISTPAKLMSATPALQPSKRCYMSPDDDSTGSPNKLVRRPQRSRSLKFDTPVKNTDPKDDISKNHTVTIDDDILDILPDDLFHSIREKERKNLEEQSPAITQAKRRQKMIAGLPKLFDRIHFLFQSIKRSVTTKDDLIYKIISSNLDIVDRRDIEEQLGLLQDLAPEWIYEKSAYSGDLLVGIKKISSPESIRAKLTEAK